jgi:hypothetical protein
MRKTGSGNRVITAGDVALLPFVILDGNNAGLYNITTGMSISPILDIRRDLWLEAWIERATLDVPGIAIDIVTLTGFRGTEWLTVLGRGCTGNNTKVSLPGRCDCNYSVGVMLRALSVLAGDVVRWRVTYD